MKNFDSPVLDLVFSIPTWSRFYFWKYLQILLYSPHPSRPSLNITSSAILHCPSWGIMSFSWYHETSLNYYSSWALPYRIVALNMPVWLLGDCDFISIYIRRVFVCSLCLALTCALMVRSWVNHPASCMRFPNRNVGRALSLGLKWAANL